MIFIQLLKYSQPNFLWRRKLNVPVPLNLHSYSISILGCNCSYITYIFLISNQIFASVHDFSSFTLLNFLFPFHFLKTQT